MLITSWLVLLPYRMSGYLVWAGFKTSWSNHLDVLAYSYADPGLACKIVYPFRCGRWTTYSSFPDMKANVWQLLADGVEQVLMVLISVRLAGLCVAGGLCSEEASVELNGHCVS